MKGTPTATKPTALHRGRIAGYARTIRKDHLLYIMLIPGIAYYLIFHYAPMYGVIIAFKDFRPSRGIIGSRWVGFAHYVEFFRAPNAWRVIWNTLVINLYQVLFSYPAPIILASMLNEVHWSPFKRLVQSVSYLPYFLSMVVIAGIVVNFLSPSTGILNHLLVRWFGIRPIFFMGRPEWWRTVYVVSGIWQHMGWNTIIFLAALSTVDPQLYEAALIDGASRWQRYRHITLIAILPTAVIVLILRIGGMLTLDVEKTLLMYNPLIYETADIIPTYVYRRGLLHADYSHATAVNLFQSIIGFVLVVGANKLGRRVSETSLW